MKYIQQLDETDCGAACLAIIASFYGKKLSVAEIRNHAGTDVIGTNLNGILKASKKYGLKATAVKGTVQAITPKLSTPFIAHMHIQRSKDNWVDHYIVVKKIKKNKIEVWDPDPLYKKEWLSYTKFFEWWTGYTVFFEPAAEFKKSTKKESLLLKFIPVFLPHTKTLVYSFLSSVLLLVFGIVTSFYYKYLFDEVVYSKAMFSLRSISFGILLIVLIQSIVETIRNSLLSHFSFKTDLQLNFSYLSHIFKLPLSFFESRKSGEVLSRLGDLNTIKQTLSSAAVSGIMDVVMLVVSAPILFSINTKLFGISIVTVIFAIAVSVIYAKIYRSYYSKSMSQNAEVQSYLYESLNGVATVKAFNVEEIVNYEYEKKKMTAIDTGWTLNKYGISQGFISGLINGISSLLVYWLGCSSIIEGTMSFGALITFNSLLGYFTGPLFRLINIQNQIQEALVAAERVGEILELECEKDDSINYMKPEKIKGHIKFDDITFAYGSRRPVYEHLNLEIASGSWTAFVGPSGCGKSTFVKLILRFYEASEGKIYLDGYDIRDIDISHLRSKIGYVPQDIFLFSGSVRGNIALHNPDASLEDIIEASKKAGAHQFIEKLPNRYDTELGEHGGGLSGGEQQRLALARALLGNPSFIILDEATSSLDTVSEMEIHKVIKQLKTENIAVILIAHRLTTVMNCDKIFVMKEGKIVEQGTHNELLKNGGLYSEMWSEVYE
ncbi:MAG TPA: peptidase domain-containing ABC transporter [Treponemataceae bacterium]|nr:peptidase domain-containing ABC transporter [Treponemataceae bacterium]HQL05207.1 peptidase domain-containing ABC transporter [Treponemataceae bacterium]